MYIYVWNLLDVGNFQAAATRIRSSVATRLQRSSFLCISLTAGHGGRSPKWTNPKWTTYASLTPPFIHPDKNTAQKGQRGPAEVKLLGYEEI